MSAIVALILAASPACALSGAEELYFSSCPYASAELYCGLAEASKTGLDYLNAAYVARETGDIDKAAAFMDKALGAHPENSELLDYSASIELSRRNWEKARFLLETRAKLPEPLRPADHVNLARAYLGLGDDKTAEKHFRAALARDRNFALAWYFLAKLAESRKNLTEAAKCYSETLKSDSQFLEARRDAGEVLRELGDYDQAWLNYTKASNAEPGNAFLKQRLAEIAPKLTKKPEQILPPKIIARHSRIGLIPARGSPSIRVGLGTDMSGLPVCVSSISFSPANQFTVRDGSTGKKLATGAGGEFWSVTASSGAAQLINSSGTVAARFSNSITIHQSEKYAHTTILRGLASGSGTAWENAADRELRGDLKIIFSKKRDGFYAVNLLNIEEYAAGVLAAEMPASYPLGALKAQAVMARTYALHYSKAEFADWSYDICDEQHCQVYAGVSAETPRTNAAVLETRGLALTSGGGPIAAYFSSNCGGFTQDGTYSGWPAAPYLRTVSDYLDWHDTPGYPYGFVRLLQYTPDAFCGSAGQAGDPQFRWTRFVAEADLRARAAALKNIGRIKAVVPVKRSESGHTGRLRIQGQTGDIFIDNDYPIRKILGIGAFRSSDFVVETNYGPDKMPESFIFYGGGWGHGVGCCQTGAKGHAEAGESFSEILSHYYPGAELSNIAAPSASAKQPIP
ncbi:MAG: SpoIID/LytB domain-containing protein [Elusimicrobiales bacterium]